MQPIVRFASIIKNGFRHGLLMRTLLAGVVEIVEMLSRRYIEDVADEVQCEGMIRMDKIKTKISRFRVSSQAISRLRRSLDIDLSYDLIIRTTAL